MAKAMILGKHEIISSLLHYRNELVTPRNNLREPHAECNDHLGLLFHWHLKSDKKAVRSYEKYDLRENIECGDGFPSCKLWEIRQFDRWATPRLSTYQTVTLLAVVLPGTGEIAR